nr:NAD(P)-dependent oxidoreductase [Streptomyces sp. DASNCL29]
MVVTSDTGEEADAHLADAEVLITTPFWPLYLDEKRMARARKLKLVITAGVGSDHIDMEAAGRRGIRGDRQQRGQCGRAQRDADPRAGLVGLGAIGARTALRLKGFDVRMLYYANHRRSPAEETTLGVTYARLDDLVAESDVICLALPLMAGSKALFDRERLNAMKPGSWLVNTARGAIVVTDALVAALESGRLAGYAGDTWYPEPAQADHPWRTMPRHAMTIHYSGMTIEAQKRIAAGVEEILRAHLGDQPLPSDYVPVDPTS